MTQSLDGHEWFGKSRTVKCGIVGGSDLFGLNIEDIG